MLADKVSEAIVEFTENDKDFPYLLTLRNRKFYLNKNVMSKTLAEGGHDVLTASLIYVMAGGLFSLTLFHPLRKRKMFKRNMKKFNNFAYIAAAKVTTDYLIEQSKIMSMNPKVRDMLTQDEDASSITLEQLYRKYWYNPGSIPKTVLDQIKNKITFDMDMFQGDDEAAELLEDIMQSDLPQIARRMEAAGIHPGNEQRTLQALSPPKVTWKSLLGEELTDSSGYDYKDYMRPNFYWTFGKFIMPSYGSSKLKKLSTILDVSGSINDDTLGEIANELQGIIELTGHTLHCLAVDTRVCSHETFEPGEDVKLTMVGGGGTDFVPGFDYIEKKGIDPEVLVYMTDGFCDSFPQEPEYKVVWLLIGNWVAKDFNPPFGVVINTKDYA